jgi:tRNA dimethylallyltransferase
VTPPTVVVLGPTASGKSTVALAAAQACTGTEIVAADALQLYRGMDVGTAKPTAHERAAVRHHGIDLVEPWEDATVVVWRRAYDEALASIAARQGRALVVGGTGLYCRFAVDRLEAPAEFPEVRAALEAEPDTVGLHRRLAELDPAAASRMEPTNRRRVVRALEVTLGSGRAFSSYGPGLEVYPPTPIVQIGLRWPRDVLGARIEARFQAMVDGGLLAEVDALSADPRGWSRTASQALGYKELADHLAGRCSLEAAIELAVRRTRQFAVRQIRWFRRDPRVRWVDLRDDPSEAVPIVLEALCPSP